MRDLSVAKALPFELPDAPVDGFEFTVWLVITHDLGDHIVEPIRFVYRVNRTWAEEFPEDEDRRGAPFVDEWIAYTQADRFSRAADGWRGIERCFRDRNHNLYHWAFATKAEALEVARRRLREKANALRDRLRETEGRILLDREPAPRVSEDGER
ncbi:MAG: hypothetical protein KF782_15425 [Labilithrix sp.]|nr:hypothetical protein [Labilithrix sp.]